MKIFAAKCDNKLPSEKDLDNFVSHGVAGFLMNVKYERWLMVKVSVCIIRETVLKCTTSSEYKLDSVVRSWWT